MVRTFLYAFSDGASPDRLAEHDEWYERHVGDILEHTDGVVGATRYRVDDRLPTAATVPGRHLVVYELDGDDPLAILGQLRRQMDDGTVCDSDVQVPRGTWLFQEVAPRRSAPPGKASSS